MYNGKEFNEDLGLNWYAYGARYYDPTIGRFTGVDPIADQFPWVSVYNYAENSPIANIDLHGLQAFYAADGRFLGKYGNSEEERVVNDSKKAKDVENVFAQGPPTLIGMFIPDLLSDDYSAKLYRSEGLNQLYDEFAKNHKGAEVEHVMVIYEKMFFDENGTSFEGYQPGKVYTDNEKSNVFLGGSEFSGSWSWRIHSAIHNHPNNSFFSGYENIPQYGIGVTNDLGWAIYKNAKALLARPNNDRIATFDPTIYNMTMTLNNYSKYKSWEHRPSVMKAVTERKIGE